MLGPGTKLSVIFKPYQADKIGRDYSSQILSCLLISYTSAHGLIPQLLSAELQGNPSFVKGEGKFERLPDHTQNQT